MSSRNTILLFFPREPSESNHVKALFPNQRALLAQMSEDTYEKRIVKGEECIRHTHMGDDFEPEMIAYSETTALTDAWQKLVNELDDESISYQTWFVVWQSMVSSLHSMVTSESFDSMQMTLQVMFRFCVELPGCMGWIGMQTLRDSKVPALDPSLEIYSKLRSKWSDPNGKSWSEEVASMPKNPLPRLPIHLWSQERSAWLEGATLEEHQTSPLMFMNENSIMQGTLLYHFLGKGKSAASISISRMYPRRNVIVMVPASLRSNYEKEIAAFGGHEYRKQNEWVFVPVSFQDARGRSIKLWNPSSEFQFRLPYLSFKEELGKRIGGFWLPRTYPGKKPNINYKTPSNRDFDALVEAAVDIMTKKRFRIIHYNAGKSTYHQLVRYGLEPSARLSLLRHLLSQPENTVEIEDPENEVHRFEPQKEKCWNKFNVFELVNTIVNFSFKHPEWNPFNGSLVIVDESHNFISQMMTKLGNLMYLLRMHSVDTRSVLLSGTPIMNHPIEFLYMFDFMKGPRLSYLLSTESNPARSWLPGTSHSTVMANGSRRLLVKHPYIGWKQSADGEIFAQDPNASLQAMKQYFGTGGRMIGNGILVSESRYGVVYKRDKMWKVDSDATLDTFTRNILNSQKNGFRTGTDLVRRMVEAVISYQGKTSDISSEFPETTTHEVACEMRPYQALIYLTTRLHESQIESGSAKSRSRDDAIVDLEERDQRIGDAAMNMVVEQDSSASSKGKGAGSGMYRIFSRQVCNMTFHPNTNYDVTDKSTATDRNPVDELRSEDCWLPDHPLRGDAKRSLLDYSIKYAKALANIRTSPGLVLLYTFFRVREGIESFERILQEYGGRRVKKQGVIEDRREPVEGRVKYPIRITHPLDGTEVDTFICEGDLLWRGQVGINENVLVAFMGRKDGTTEVVGNDTEVTVCVYGEGSKVEMKDTTWSDMKLLPFQYGVVSGEDKEDRGALISLMRSERNRKGVDATILLITKAGAEGLDLKSIRQVHVMEPFWNKVRVQQVVGRGSRNKSHNYLAPEEHTVTNYVYKAVMSGANMLLKRLLKMSRTKQKTEEELVEALLGMSETAVRELESKGIQSIVTMPDTSSWSEKFQRLQSQYVSDGGLTSDEYVNKVSEVKQVLIDQALTLFSSTSIEETRSEKKFDAKPVFLTPFTVYNNPNVPLESYLMKIRDTLSVKKTTHNPTPRGRFRIPVYYVPFYVIDKATNVWKEQIMELDAEWTLSPDESLTLSRESPIHDLVTRFQKRFEGKKLDADPTKHMQKLLRQAQTYVNSRISSVPIVFMSDSHKEAIVKDLLQNTSLASRKFNDGTFKTMSSSQPPLQFKPDDSMDVTMSDAVRAFWSRHGFKP